MNRWLEILYMTIMFGITLLPLALPLVLLWDPNFRWIPRRTGRRPAIRHFEVLTLLCLGLLGASVYYLQHAPVLSLKSFHSESLIDRWTIWESIGSLALLLTGLLLAWRWSTSIAMTLLYVSTVAAIFVGGAVASIQHKREWEQQVAAMQHRDTDPSQAKPVTLRFELIDNLAGADLWINDVHLGKTPVEISSRDLFAKVAPWPEYPQEKQHATGPQGEYWRRWGWCPLHLTDVSNSSQFYFKVELNGVPGYSQMSGQKSIGPERTPASYRLMTLDTKFPQWEQEIENLLDTARFHDYQVDAHWLQSFRTYGEYGRRRLELSESQEPELLQLRQNIARLDWKLDDVHDGAGAFQKLLEIEATARSSGEYSSVSSEGLAIEQLVMLLDPQQVINHARTLLQTSATLSTGSHSSNRDRFATYDDNSNSKRDAGLWPVAHAVWRIDQRFDKQRIPTAPVDEPDTEGHAGHDGNHAISLQQFIDPEADNIVERLLTTDIVRLSYNDESRLQYAGILGGSAYEQLLVRSNWSAPANGPFHGNVRIGMHENYVNAWYYRLMFLQSPLGRAFRDRENQRLQELARTVLNEEVQFSPSFPNKFEFLFIDRVFGPKTPSLAMQFWPDFDRICDSAPNHARQQVLNLRLDYLGRMWPESTPEMFYAALLKAQRGYLGRNFPQIPQSIPDKDQFQILRYCIQKEKLRVETLPKSPPEKEYQGERKWVELLIGDLENAIQRLPCQESAEIVFANLNESADMSIRKNWSDQLAFATRQDDLIRLLAKSEKPQLQLIVIPAIEHHPTPARYQLLEHLAQASDQEVKVAATAAQQRIQDMVSRLPQRGDLKPAPEAN